VSPDYPQRSKTELLELARNRNIRGRSRMTKAELIEALMATDPEPSEHVTVRTVDRRALEAGARQDGARRKRLDERLAGYFDSDRRCPWTTIEGYPCGLPAVVKEVTCALHGGLDIFDLAVPLAGHLGFDTWPALFRHLVLATYDTDPLGLDPVVAEIMWHLTNWLYFDYFRVDVEGAEHLPSAGPALVTANHGGAALPYDAFMLSAAVTNEGAVPRRLRVVGTEIFNMLPWISHLYRKAGGAYASRVDADYVLRSGHLLGVFPEGEKGFMKPVWDAYQVQRFGRGGFLSLAEANAAPIVPVAIVGSEEVHPAVGVSETLARAVRFLFPEQRVDQIAVVLNPIPLPVRWRIRFLPAVQPEGVDTLRDPLRTLERTEQIRHDIQAALDEMVAGRRGVF
jgi:1-acyl-sn-glycerol-3-phosphate acyltransferase